MSKTYRCLNCEDHRWVCENHEHQPWDEDGDGCALCGGAGMPCKECNPCDRDHPPEMPAGVTVLWSRIND